MSVSPAITRTTTLNGSTDASDKGNAITEVATKKSTTCVSPNHVPMMATGPPRVRQKFVAEESALNALSRLRTTKIDASDRNQLADDQISQTANRKTSVRKKTIAGCGCSLVDISGAKTITAKQAMVAAKPRPARKKCSAAMERKCHRPLLPSASVCSVEIF